MRATSASASTHIPVRFCRDNGAGERVIRAVEPHDSVERYTALGVDLHRRPGARHVTVDRRGHHGGRTARADDAQHRDRRRCPPAVPPIPGLAEAGYLTSDTVWDLRVLPRRLLVLGGGPIGCELAQAFARLGAAVTQVEMLPRILMREDVEVSDLVRASFEADGVRVLAGHRAERVVVEGGDKILIADHEGREVRIVFDQVLVAVGRSPTPRAMDSRISASGPREQRTLATDARSADALSEHHGLRRCRRPVPVHAHGGAPAWDRCGQRDVRDLRRFEADYRVVPWAIFTDPEVARVGSTSRRRARRTSRTRRRSTASTTSTARSPKAPRTDSSRF